METASQEKSPVALIAEVGSAEKHHKQLFGLDFSDLKDVPHLVCHFLLRRGMHIVLHPHQLLDGDDRVLLEVVVERSALFALLSGGRARIPALV